MEIKQVFVSSENRDKSRYPYGNSYTLHITEPIKDIHHVELLYASVPNTIYNLPNGANVIQFSNLLSNIGDPLTTFSIPPGFYNASELASQITDTISNITGITVSYQSAEGKYLFTRPIGSNTFSMNVNSNHLATMLGFDYNITENSSNVAVSSGLNIDFYSDNSRYVGQEWIKSKRVIDLKSNEGIFLDIEELRTPYTEDAKSITGNTYSGENITRTFGLIPMDVNGGDIKNFKKNTDYDFSVEYTYPIRKLERLTVNWVNRLGQRVSFNGAEDNSFMLRFHTLRKNI
jgi:hypothetical protein